MMHGQFANITFLAETESNRVCGLQCGETGCMMFD